MSILLLSTKIDDIDEKPLYSVEKEGEAFARYSKGLIYIGNVKYLSSIIDNKDEKDILILDERSRNDPNMKIISSYKISDRQDKKEILNAMSLYEDNNPSDWNRSYNSMLVEWEVHNFLHDLGFKRSRTTDVDFNNEDEKIYDDLSEFILKMR